MNIMPSADYVIDSNDHLMIMTSNEIAEILLTKKKNKFVTY